MSPPLLYVISLWILAWPKIGSFKISSPHFGRGTTVCHRGKPRSLSLFFPREIGSSRSLSHKYSSWVVLQEHGIAVVEVWAAAHRLLIRLGVIHKRCHQLFSSFWLLPPPCTVAAFWDFCPKSIWDKGDSISGQPHTPFWLYKGLAAALRRTSRKL